MSTTPSCIPRAHLKFCTKHLIGNARHDKGVVNSFHDNQVWDIQGAANAAEAEQKFLALGRSSPSAEAYFRNIKPESWCTWATSSTIAMHGKKTSNHVEAANSMVLPARAEDPMHAADKITALVGSKPYTWLMDAEGRKAQGEVLTAYAAKKFAEQDQLSRFYTVSMVSATSGYVTATRGARHRYHVNLNSSTCSCDGPYQSQMACRHVIAAAKNQGLMRRDKLPGWLASSFHLGYFLDTYIALLKRATEVTCVKLVDIPSLVIDPDGIPILPAVPHSSVGAGRPRTKRIRSRGEIGGSAARPPEKYKCGRCKAHGHNAATCTVLM